MKRLLSALAVLSLASAAVAQQPYPMPNWQQYAAYPSYSDAPVAAPAPLPEAPARAAGTQGFSDFIGFMSNPVRSNDPRALTQLWPMFGSYWVNGTRALPNSDFQVYGVGLNIALTDRLSLGFNNGGYAVMHITRDQGRLDRVDNARAQLGLPPTPFRGGTRDGFTDLGGFVQYTAVADCDKRLLVTAGVNWIAPSGSTEVFAGKGPLHLAPYLTVGKGLGNFHVLATGGYQFPVGGGNNDLSRVAYLSGHLDYQLCEWIYPLVELNWSRNNTSVNPDLQTRRGFVNLGNFDTVSTNILTLAAGVNLVLIRDRLEIGAVYSTPVTASPDVFFNGLLVKMICRF